MPNKTKTSKPKGRKGKRIDRIPPPISGTSGTLSRAREYVFPPRMRRILRYADVVSITSTSGGNAYYQFRANSLFDPDLSGTGHQPRAFDQLCGANGPYATYRVHSISARVEFTLPVTNPWGIACGFMDVSSLSGGVSGAGIGVSYAELPGWIATVLPLTGPTKTMKQKATMAQIHNVPPAAILTDDSYAAAYNANPVDTAYFTIIGNCIPANTETISFAVFLEFDVTFEDPFPLAPS